jgi:integrase
VPLKTVSDILGHTDIRTTANIYGHTDDDQKRDAADKIAGFFEDEEDEEDDDEDAIAIG